METQIFNQDELGSTFALREDAERDAQILSQLLDDPDILIERPFRPVRLHEYQGTVFVQAQTVNLTFHHKGGSNGHRLSALRSSGGISSQAVQHLRQVIFQNARRLNLGITARRPPFQKQPPQLNLRTRTGGGGGGGSTGKPYKESMGYWGERHFVEYLQNEFPHIEIDWLNRDTESGQPYDVLLDGRLAVDVKATRIERSYVDLSSAERAFRDQIGSAHALAIVTLRDDVTAAPLSIDLYLGQPARQTALAELKTFIDRLDRLELGSSGSPNESNDVEEQKNYFRPGRYLAEGSSSLIIFGAAGEWWSEKGGERAHGRYEIVGHHVVLRAGEGHRADPVDRFHISMDGGHHQLMSGTGERYLLQS